MIKTHYKDKPVHNNDCDECKFLFGLMIEHGEKIFEYVDVYEQCDCKVSKSKETKYLIRHGDHEKYSSSVTLKQLIGSHFCFHMGIKV